MIGDASRHEHGVKKNFYDCTTIGENVSLRTKYSCQTALVAKYDKKLYCYSTKVLYSTVRGTTKARVAIISTIKSLRVKIYGNDATIHALIITF